MPPNITYHKANHESHTHPPNTLEAVRACLDAGADWIEIDIVALASQDYLVIHDETLDNETNGSGPVNVCDVMHAHTLHLKNHPDYQVPLLSQVITLLTEHPHKAYLQLDFKSAYPFPDDEPLHRLLRLIAPAHGQIQISSASDWHLRALRRLDSTLNLGFEIMFYFDLRDPNHEYDPRLPPYREGAYGYHDDALLSLARIWPITDYLTDRCEVLLRQVPGISTLYINHHVVLRGLDEGFNWVDAAHAAGIKLCAWTIDVDQPGSAEVVQRLRDAGVDRITSNTPNRLSQLLLGKP